jgi:rfaE bifunctional protein nucleotidyltransferase chain/domain
VELVSLQKGPAAEQIGQLKGRFAVRELASEQNPAEESFVDTAAIMANLDLVVSVDTAIAHLAGALGRPVWVALSTLVDWRWMLGREDNPWYPTMRLFRQEKQDDWQPVFHRMAGELRQRVAGPSPAAKVVDWPALRAAREAARAAGKTVAWTNGCFDVLHAGHVQSLEAARRHGDVLVVGLNGDASVRRLKGPDRPVFPAGQRAAVLAALACVDYVVVFDEDTPEAALARLRPDVHCKGADYAPPHGKPVPEAAVVGAYGGRVEFLPLAAGLSTTDALRRLRDGRKEP